MSPAIQKLLRDYANRTKPAFERCSEDEDAMDEDIPDGTKAKTDADGLAQYNLDDYDDDNGATPGSPNGR